MNKLFSTALVRMTVLYVLVLAFVCTSFSVFLYSAASNEIDRTSRRQIVGFRTLMGRFVVDEAESERMREQESSDAKQHLRVNLFLVNLSVIGGGAVMCYFFAKKTLQPIEESVRAQERFTSDASHELRTPLASMKTEVEVALRDPKLSAKDAKELLASNLEEVNNLQVMTENLLSLARNREMGETRVVELHKLLKATVKKYEPATKKAGMRIVLHTTEMKLLTNAGAIRQILQILLDNAIKYAGKDAEIHIENSVDDAVAYITVSDNGVGMPTEQLRYIFDRFYKADSSRTASRVSGHGLGLSIAKQLVQALRGEISAAEGPDGKGVQFRISLPVL